MTTSLPIAVATKQAPTTPPSPSAIADEQPGDTERLPRLGVESVGELDLPGAIVAAALPEHLAGQASQCFLRLVEFEVHHAAPTVVVSPEAGRNSGSVSSSSTAS